MYVWLRRDVISILNSASKPYSKLGFATDLHMVSCISYSLLKMMFMKAIRHHIEGQTNGNFSHCHVLIGSPPPVITLLLIVKLPLGGTQIKWLGC